MSLQDFIKPELIILIPVLYFIGRILKSSKIPDHRIPAVLGIGGILLSTLYVAANCPLDTLPDIAMGLFVSITQGVLVAGSSVYVHQLKIQHKHGKEQKQAQKQE